ncbi:hypothetical protein PFY10_18330 [Chryseobacterium daecheongense]|nr:hypothetical protein PFY10_18330 [Chryseobacterium daecheongense]
MEQTEESGLVHLISPLDGGYVLKIDARDKYFPQCCCGLDDIKSWEELLSEDSDSYFYIDHPSPIVTQNENQIIFDFSDSSISEAFTPPIAEKILIVDRILLDKAIEVVKNEVNLFAERL